MNHLQRIYSCTSEDGAKKCAARIARELQTYRSATAMSVGTQMTNMEAIRENIPERINPNDEIEDTSIGKGYRSRYRRKLANAWCHNNQKAILESAYSIAVRKVATELHLSSRAAKELLLARAKAAFFETFEG